MIIANIITYALGWGIIIAFLASIGLYFDETRPNEWNAYEGYPIVVNALLAPIAILIWARVAIFILFNILEWWVKQNTSDFAEIEIKETAELMHRIANFDTFSLEESWLFWMLG